MDKTIRNTLNSSGQKINEDLYKKNKDKNYLFSPISFNGLVNLIYFSSGDDTKNEINKFIPYNKEFYESLGTHFTIHNSKYEIDDNRSEEKIIREEEKFNNYIWVDKEVHIRKNYAKSFPESFKVSLETVDFENENEQANSEIRELVKEDTNGLIDQNFNFKEDTKLVFMNTYYLKFSFDDYDLNPEKTEFLNKDGSISKINYVRSDSYYRKPYKGSKYTSFYVEGGNYKMYFIKPDEGADLTEAFNENELKNILSSWRYKLTKADGYFETYCVFPKFEVKDEHDLNDYLMSDDFINLKKKDLDIAKKVTTVPLEAKISKQFVKLKVDEKGVEGAAVSFMGCLTTGMPKLVSFNVDKYFGYIITNKDGEILFIGSIANL